MKKCLYTKKQVEYLLHEIQHELLLLKNEQSEFMNPIKDWDKLPYYRVWFILDSIQTEVKNGTFTPKPFTDHAF